MSERRDPEDLFDALLDYEHDDPDAKPIAEMTRAECDAELASFGVDPVALHARGAAHVQKLLDQLGPAPAPPAPPAPKAPYVAHAQPAPLPSAAAGHTVWLWIAAGVVVAVLALRFVFGGNDNVVPKGPIPTPAPVETDASAPPPKQPDPPLIAAREACARQAWAECLRDLDVASAQHLTGDQAAEEAVLRGIATRGLAEATKDGGPDKKAPGPNPKAPH